MLKLRYLFGTIMVVVFLLAAVAVFFCPIYFAFTHSPIWFFLFFVTWIPALVLIMLGVGIGNLTFDT